MNRIKISTIFTILLCLLVSTVYTGCNENGDIEYTDENCDFSVFFGNLDEPIKIDTMLSEYEKNTGVSIHPIIIPDSKDNQGELESILANEQPPAAFACASDVDLEWLEDSGYVSDFSTIDEKQTGTSIPYLINGYGLAYDKSMFIEMFGERQSQKLVNDLKQADFDQWKAFLESLNDFINDRPSEKFRINKNTYALPKSKGELTNDLNGIFSIPGASDAVFGNSIFNIVAQAADMSSWENVKAKTSISALNVMDPALTTYIDGLDTMTSYLSGKYSAGIRGKDLTNDIYYSTYLTDDMFMSGKSMFNLLDSKKYNEMKSLNAKKAEELNYLPIKMPYDKSFDKSTSEGALLNSSLPVEVTHSFYVNKKMDKDTQKKALDFLIWFSEKEEQWDNPLRHSLKEYVKQENTLQYDYSPELLEDWMKDVFSDGGMSVFLRKQIWSEEYKEEMKLFMVEKWVDN